MEIIFGQGVLPLSYLIQWATGHKFSHSALKYPNEEWMIHSTLGGVQPEWFSFFKNHYKTIKKYRCKFPHSIQSADNIIPIIGHKSYGYVTLIGIGLILFLKKFGINLNKNIFGNKNTFICTEVMIQFFNDAQRLNPSLGMPIFNSETMKVNDLEDFIVSRPDLFEFIEVL